MCVCQTGRLWDQICWIAGGLNGIVHVQCGNPTSSSTATTATTTTTFSSKKPSSEIINSEHPNTVSITDRNSTTNTHSSPENLMEDPNNPICKTLSCMSWRKNCQNAILGCFSTSMEKIDSLYYTDFAVPAIYQPYNGG